MTAGGSTASEAPVVILGAGLAGASCARALRAAGRPVMLVDPAPAPIVELPPLSNSLFSPELQLVPIAGGDSGLDHRRAAAVQVHLERRSVLLSDGEELDYSTLVVATGMSARSHPEPLPGGPALTLRTSGDAQGIRAVIDGAGPGAQIGILGSGWLALELARGAVDAGHRVAVHLRGDRPLAAVSPVLAEALMRIHAQAGVEFVPNSTREDRADCALWLVAIGADANTAALPRELERSDHGALLVDEFCRAAPHVHAIGDAARIIRGPMAACGRLENEPMAMSQGQWLAARILGQDAEPWTALPWHWSFQGPVRAFTAGMAAADARGEPVVLGDPLSDSFQVALFDGAQPESRLSGVETLGRPPLHNHAKKVLSSDAPPTRSQVQDPGFDMRAAARSQSIPRTVA